MMKIFRLVFLVLSLLSITVMCGFAKIAPPQLSKVATPLYFIENQGQIDKSVRFYEKSADHAMYFTDQAVHLSLNGKERSGSVSLTPVGANTSITLSTENPQVGKINYLIGNDKNKWKTNVPTFGAVRYENVYDGIDLKFYGIGKTLEYDVIVEPGADPATVRLSYDGIEKMRINENGELEIGLNNGVLFHKKPYIYQQIDGEKVVIDGNFKIVSADHKKGFVYGFEVASYDREKELVIDPVLIFGSYIGSGSLDRINDLAIDASGNMIITGQAFAGTYPLSGQIYTYAGNYDAFISSIDPNTGTLNWSTYYGGAESEYGNSIAVDPSGNVYVTGSTTSVDFPMPITGYQTTKQGAATVSGAYLVKLNSTGDTVLYSTFFSGGFADYATGVALDSTNNAHIVGYSQSTNLPMLNGYMTNNPGVNSVFIAKFDTTQTGAGSLLYSSWLGGTLSDYGYAVTICDFDYTYITGETLSTDFSTFPSAPAHSGGSDSFVAVFNTSVAGASSLQGSHLFGGAQNDVGYGIAVDAGAANYITGNTASADFPKTTVPAPLGGSLVGSSDAFVTKIDPFSGAISFSTFLGGEINDTGNDITLDPSETTISVIGETTSSAMWFPLVNPTYNTAGVGNDMFIAQLSTANATLTYSTFIGGGGQDYGTGIAIDSLGDIYFAGYSNSNDMPLIAEYSPFVFDYDGYIGKLGLPIPLPDITVTDSLLPDNDLSANYNGVVLGNFADVLITVANDGDEYLNIGDIDAASGLAAPFSIPAATDFCSNALVMPFDSCQLTARFSPTVVQAYNATVIIPSDDPDENPVNFALSGFGIGAPDITVIDPIDPFDDLDITPPDPVLKNTVNYYNVDVKNDGGSDLTITGVSFRLYNFMAIFVDNCTEVSLPPAGTCSITFTFSPPAVVSPINYLDNLYIDSDDPDESRVDINIRITAVPDPVPVLEITDSVVPFDDSDIPFGSTTVGTPLTEVVTLRNTGMYNSTLDIISVNSGLAAPFATTNDLCSGQSLTYNSTCTFDVVFNPGTAGSFPEALTVGSNVNPQAVTMSGDATIIEKPEIIITNTSGSPDGRIVEFGNITTGQTVNHDITVTNLGTTGSTLDIYNVAVINALASPLSLIVDNCSQQTLAYNSACTMRVQYAPDSTGPDNQSFDIPNNDGDSPDNPAFVSVSGTGIPPLVSEITVYNSSAVVLNDGATISFGPAEVGSTLTHNITVSSDGTTSLGSLFIASSDPLSSPFSITSNCSNTLVNGTSCTETITYTPLSSGSHIDSFSIQSDDADESFLTINLDATATPQNNPPPAPRAIYPNDNATGLPDFLNLRWESVTDSDGDPLTYELYYSTDPTFNSVSPIPVIVSTEPVNTDVLYAGLGGASTLLLLACIPFMTRHRRELMIVVACVALLSCGGASDDNAQAREGYTKVTINMGGLSQGLSARAAQTGSPAPEYVNYVQINVEGPDMTQIKKNVTAGYLGILEVPNGPMRSFEATAFSQTGVEVHYSPSAVYADLDGNPVALAIFMAERTTGAYFVSGLTPATTYYWKIVVNDGQTSPVSSPVYSFTTQ